MAPDAQDPDVPDAQDVRNAINDVMQDLQVNLNFVEKLLFLVLI